MAFGYERIGRTFLNNSMVLNAYLYTQDDQSLIPAPDITDVTFTVLKPGDAPAAPSVAGDPGEVTADGQGQYVVDPSINNTEGEYRAYALFTYDEGTLSGLTKSVPVFYDVIDMFERTGASPMDPAVDLAWLKLEDCFDSEFGGPWLRDMTMRVFDKTKLREFGPTVLLQINTQMPLSTYTITTFPFTSGDATAVFAQGLLVETIRHLMRAYTEQPDVTSSPVGFLDRKRYADAWRATYAEEEKLFERWLNRWKLASIDITHASILLGSKAGRMLPAPMRSRNVGRGF